MKTALLFYCRSLRRPVFLFLFLQFLLRTLYFALDNGEIQATFWEALFIYGYGFFQDLCVISFLGALFALYRLFIKTERGKIDRAFRNMGLFFFLIVLFFSFIADILFWNEFKARFNFIAVDYLVYSKEVVANIKESYNLPILLGAVICFSIGILCLHRKKQKPFLASEISLKNRVVAAVLSLILPMATPFLPFDKPLEHFENQLQKEVAQNGWYTFVQAFFSNTIDFQQFYITSAEIGADPFTFSHRNTRDILSEEKRCNVIFVLMESMSADFMKAFGNGQNLTPSLDALAEEGLFFTRFYATGTRTVRGMEALVLSLPPVPGQAVIRRPHNENLHGIGFEFQKRGYETAFIYGGQAYFDNMGPFMEGNGFHVIDRNHFSSSEVRFENAWGLCDEDLFDKVIKEGDRLDKDQKPFMFVALTTSNHRPYTFPSGKIDLAPKSGRESGVKYADFSIGEFIRKAKEKPWFQKTLFVFLADHTAGTTGHLEITPEKHHIPAIIYAPHLVKSQKIDSIVSQIDLPVTVMGLLNFKLEKPFFGQDVLKNPSNRAFLSHFQKIAYMDDVDFLILKPVKNVSVFKKGRKVENKEEQLSALKKAVPAYEEASKWREIYKKP